MMSLNFEQFEAILGHSIDAKTREGFELFARSTERIESLAICRRLWLDGLLKGLAPEQIERARILRDRAAEDVRLLMEFERGRMVWPPPPPFGMGADPNPASEGGAK